MNEPKDWCDEAAMDILSNLGQAPGMSQEWLANMIRKHMPTSAQVLAGMVAKPAKKRKPKARS